MRKSLLKACGASVAALTVLGVSTTASAWVLDIGDAVLTPGGSTVSLPIFVINNGVNNIPNINSLDATLDFTVDIPANNVKLNNFTFVAGTGFIGNPTATGGNLGADEFISMSGLSPAVLNAGSNQVGTLEISALAGASPAIYAVTAKIGSPVPIAGFNGDGSEQTADSTLAGSITVTPEPASLGLLATAASVGLIRRRRNRA